MCETETTNKYIAKYIAALEFLYLDLQPCLLLYSFTVGNSFVRLFIGEMKNKIPKHEFIGLISYVELKTLLSKVPVPGDVLFDWIIYNDAYKLL